MKGYCSACGLAVGESFGCTGTEWPLPNGLYAKPVPFGEEQGQWEGYALTHARCPDCSVAPGMPHHLGCEVEQIPEGVETETDAYRRLHPDGQETPEAESEFPDFTDSANRTFLTPFLLRGALGWILRSPYRVTAAIIAALVLLGALSGN